MCTQYGRFSESTFLQTGEHGRDELESKAEFHSLFTYKEYIKQIIDAEN